MATGGTSGTTLNEIDKLIIKIDEKSDALEESIKNFNEVSNSIFTETSKERLNKLNEHTKKYKDNLDEVIDTLKNHSRSGFLRDLDINNINDKLDALRGKITELKKDWGTNKDEINELTKEYNLLHQASTQYYRAATEEQKELNKRQLEGVTFLDDWGEKWEQKTKALTKGVKEVGEGVKQIGTSVGKTLEPWRKANKETMAYAKSVGMSQQSADAFLSNTVSWAAKNNIGLLFNKSTDELIKLQSKYSEVLGRNVQLTSEQKKDMLAMEAFLGEEGTIDIANNLENFGLGMSDAAEFIKETIDDATKYGISASKLTKMVKDNIKMAQNYTFKDGIKGLESMAKKAASLKTDMTLVSGLAEKVSTVEGAITTGAQLQVLGGSYAMGSDPMSLLYESLNDMEGLFDRAVGMAKGKVFYNDATGQFEMGAMDRQMMKYAANAMGVDPSKMIDAAFRQASLGRIENQAMMNSNISGDKDMLELVKNLATFENGRAVVDINGKKVDVGRELSAEDKTALEAMSRTDSENLRDMAVSLRSIDDMMTGAQKEINNEQANATHGIASSLNDLLRNNTEMLNKVAKIGAWFNIITGSYGVLAGVYGTVNGILRSMYGVRNIVSGKPATLAGARPPLRETIYTSRSGQRYRRLPNGTMQNISGGRNLYGAAANNVYNHGTQSRALSQAGKAALKGGLKTGALMGGVSAALHIGSSIVNGEDTVRATRKSAVALAGNIVGGAIGAIVPGGAMVGAMLGGMVAEGLNAGITKLADKKRDEIRDSIYNELSATMPNIAKLFSGPNALEGDYRVKQLNKLKDAMSDGTLDASEVRGMKRKLRKSGDLEKIQAAGVNIQGIEMAKGGFLNGPSHIDGGMPILGTNISVEGGEYVINKEATKNNFPLLEKINSGNLKVTAKEPLGQQMKVHDYETSGLNMPHNKGGKMEMAPISLNISGTIKLDMGGQNIDITKQLLSEPKFITEITNMISKQMNIYENGSFNKDKFMQKFV